MSKPKPKLVTSAPTAAQLDTQLDALERFAADTWSNLALVDRVKAFRANFRAYVGARAIAELDAPAAAKEQR